VSPRLQAFSHQLAPVPIPCLWSPEHRRFGRRF